MPNPSINIRIVIETIQLSTAGIDAGALAVATLPPYATFAPIPKCVMDQRTDKIRNFTKSID